jgi:2-hydroxycyclohexanecarboxyl-CoA dehydrogenase
VIAFAKALAREVSRHRIRVNCVAPGPTDTPFLQIFGPDSEKILDAMVKQTPLRKLASPADIASAITFLASDEAGHITGQTLSVSGGLTMV